MKDHSAVRWPEIGDRLRAYRLGSQLSVDEIAERLGVSRAAVYRYEKGEVIKLETIGRLSKLLGVSVPSLLGVGVEYVASAVAFFERLRQLEERADRLSVLFGPISYLLTADEHDPVLHEALVATIPKTLSDRAKARTEIERLMEILKRRKAAYRVRRPTLINIVAAPEVERFLAHGLVVPGDLPANLTSKHRRFARRAVEHIVTLLETEPIGVQIGIVLDTLPMSSFSIIRQPDRSVVAISSFRLGYQPNIRVGMAMITSAEEALVLHNRVTEELWSRTIKGSDAARFLKTLMKRSWR